MRRITEYCMIYILFAGWLSSCNRMDMDGDSQNGNEVLFQGMVSVGDLVSRSSSEPDYDNDYVLINSSTDAKFGDIKICKSVDNYNDVFSDYVADDGVQGRLANKGGSPLKWTNQDSEHTFYAWTYPSVTAENTFEGGVQMDAVNPTCGTVTFGTKGDTGLETFIVAKEGPVQFSKQGSYVKLLFHRPIAKILLESVTHIDTDKNETQVDECTITFPNLYKSAEFDVKKNTGTGEDIWTTSYPSNTDTNLGIAWNWSKIEKDNDGSIINDDQSVLYVLPFEFGTQEDVDSQPDHTQLGYFTVEATIDNVKKLYFGSLAGLKDIQELKAGQYMKLQIGIQDGGGIGLGCKIVDWSTENEQYVSHHRAGIYTQEDAETLLDILQGNPVDTDALDLYCKDGGKTIYLYTSIDWSKLTENLTIPDGYTLDGQGYSIKLGNEGSLSGNYINIKN